MPVCRFTRWLNNLFIWTPLKKGLSGMPFPAGTPPWPYHSGIATGSAEVTLMNYYDQTRYRKLFQSIVLAVVEYRSR